MDITSDLVEVKDILQQILKPSKNPPYISTDEIYENDVLTRKALKIIEQTLENFIPN